MAGRRRPKAQYRAPARSTASPATASCSPRMTAVTRRTTSSGSRSGGSAVARWSSTTGWERPTTSTRPIHRPSTAEASSSTSNPHVSARSTLPERALEGRSFFRGPALGHLHPSPPGESISTERAHRGSVPGEPAPGHVQGAFGSTNRQRSRSGQSSCAGRWAWQILRPCWIRLTCASYIWSGSSMPRTRSCASSVDAFGGEQPDPPHDPLDVAVDRHQRLPEREQQQDRGGLLADAVDLRQPVARLEGGHVAEELERVVAALLADLPQRGLDARRLLVAAGRPAGSTRSARGAARTRRAAQSGATPSGSPTPPQPAPGVVRLRPRPSPG